MRTQFTLLFLAILNATTSAAEPEPSEIRHVVAVEDVCAWPNLTLTGDGEILAILHNQPAHGTQEGGPELIRTVRPPSHGDIDDRLRWRGVQCWERSVRVVDRLVANAQFGRRQFLLMSLQ